MLPVVIHFKYLICVDIRDVGYQNSKTTLLIFTHLIFMGSEFWHPNRLTGLGTGLDVALHETPKLFEV